MEHQQEASKRAAICSVKSEQNLPATHDEEQALARRANADESSSSTNSTDSAGHRDATSSTCKSENATERSHRAQESRIIGLSVDEDFQLLCKYLSYLLLFNNKRNGKHPIYLKQSRVRSEIENM